MATLAGGDAMLFYATICICALIVGYFLTKFIDWVPWVAMSNVLLIFGGLLVFLGMPDVTQYMSVPGLIMIFLSIGLNIQRFKEMIEEERKRGGE